jgi:hypothetical protein
VCGSQAADLNELKIRTEETADISEETLHQMMQSFSTSAHQYLQWNSGHLKDSEFICLSYLTINISIMKM